MLAGADERFYKDIMLSKDVTYRIGESAERDIGIYIYIYI